jgi:hypothetical protein
MVTKTLAALHRGVDRLELGPNALRVPEATARFDLRLFPRHATRHEILYPSLEVKAQLLIDIVSNVSARRRDVQRSSEARPPRIGARAHHAPSAAITSPTASV